MSGCLECESLMDLGPPPDLMPPPPIPAFLREPVKFLFSNNGSCNLCGWAEGDDVQLVEVIRKYPEIDDVWYIVIVSSAVGAILIAGLVLIAALRCKESKVKPAQHQESPKAHNKVNKLHNPMSCSSHDRMSPIHNLINHQIDGCHHTPGHKALWSGLGDPKTDLSSLINGTRGSYLLQHHIINQNDIQNSHYEKIDYGSINYPPAPNNNFTPRRHFPPLPEPPAPPPPPPPPMTTFTSSNENGVHFTPKGHAYYTNPDSIDGSFDNNGFVDSEVNASARRPKSSKRIHHQTDKSKFPCIQSTNSGLLDHLIIKDGPEKSSHLHMVTQIHLDGKYEQITSTALV